MFENVDIQHTHIPTHIRTTEAYLYYKLTNEPKHTYQSLACETAINTKFSELFSLKRIYVKYKNAILSHIGCSFRT